MIGGQSLTGTSILSTNRYTDKNGAILNNFGNFTTNATVAVYTYVLPEYFSALNPLVYEMELKKSTIPIYAEEGTYVHAYFCVW